jgi:hypothetical protein
MQIDYTISIGNIFTIVAIVFSVVASWYALKQVVAMLSLRVALMENDIKEVAVKVDKITTIMSNQAVYEERLLNMQRQLEDLKRGEGFVLPLGGKKYDHDK